MARSCWLLLLEVTLVPSAAAVWCCWPAVRPSNCSQRRWRDTPTRLFHEFLRYWCPHQQKRAEDKWPVMEAARLNNIWIHLRSLMSFHANLFQSRHRVATLSHDTPSQTQDVTSNHSQPPEQEWREMRVSLRQLPKIYLKLSKHRLTCEERRMI